MKLFSEFLTEARIAYDRYERSHGRKPKGGSDSYGGWMFTHKRTGDVDYNDDKECFQFAGTKKDAEKAALAWAKKHGYSVVYTME